MYQKWGQELNIEMNRDNLYSDSLFKAFLSGVWDLKRFYTLKLDGVKDDNSRPGLVKSR